MKRFIVLIVIAYILGIIIGLYKLSCIVLFLLTIFIIYSLYKKSHFFISKKNFKNTVIIFLCMIIGFCHIKFYNNYWENTYKNLSSNNIIVEIINLEKETNSQKTFKVRILNDKFRNKNILLKINNKQKIYNKIEIGNKIILNGELQELEVQRNTGGFDYKEYLKSKKVFGVIKFKSGRIIKNKIFSIYNLKNLVIKNAYKKLKKQDADFCLALTIGYKATFDEEIKENFSKINLSHMLAISGLHISYIIIFVNLLLRPIKSKYKSIIIIIFLVLFNQITGNIPSISRACITVILNMLAPFFYRKSDMISTLTFSALIILIQNPYVIKDLGFIFSYIGTIGIITINPIIKEKVEIFLIEKNPSLINCNIKFKGLSYIVHKILNYCLDVSLVTISANILLLPLIIYYFNSISLLFIISNIIIGPILIICIILSFIIILFEFLPINILICFIDIYSFIINMILFISQFFSRIDICNIIICTPNLTCMFIIYFAIFVYFYFTKNNSLKIKIITKIKYYLKKYNTKSNIFFIALTVVLTFTIFNIRNKNLRIYFVDVGQGDCTLIVTPNNKKILIDGGGVKSDNYDVGKKILIPYLLDRGIKQIDYIIVSHFDTDHVRTEY